MAETAAAGSVAERTAAVCACNKPGFAAKVRSRCRSLSRFLSVISLYLILLNRCSSKLRCSVSPFGHKRSPKPGSLERHHFPPGGGCLSSQKRLDPLWLAPRLPSGSLMLAERRGLSCSAERPANGGAGVPVSSPPAKQNTACLWAGAELWKVTGSCVWNLSRLFFFPPSVHCVQVLRNRSSRNTQSNKLSRGWTWGAEKARVPGLAGAGIWGVFEDPSQSEGWLSAGWQEA